jgi:hypothetical protein
MSKYGWVIMKDHIGDNSENGTMGPEGVKFTKEFIKQKGKRFRMFDDDGELYYEGYCYSEEPGSEDEFGPLDDFGEPNAGCTEIKYFENGKWETL